ncbi:MAG: hypothetical protein A2X35_12985 [Elusimicrobia bacterium GWA2_61_42]|nr:MAG: hypothetical protein A2X35_12985 [Elusimicrobia bacterium GWA2_61_42]OGR77456.1 MAG: hypothetical protein A2X38_10255 [Elusimicrobia bacterium GWC2_61_25]
MLLPKNPGTFFVFWQFSSSRAEAFRSGAFDPGIELRLACVEDGSQLHSLRTDWQTGRVYLPAAAQGRTCQAALYGLRGGAWEKLLESNQAAAPAAAGMAEERAYASMEFHKKVLS